MWGALSDENTFLSFTTAAGPCQCIHSRVRVLLDLWPYFTLPYLIIRELEDQVPIFISPRNILAQLYPQAWGSIFVASYNLRGYDGGIQSHLHTGNSHLVRGRARVTLWLAVYCHRFVLAQSPLRLTTRDFFPPVNRCGHNPYVTSSLMRGWVCLLWIGLAFSNVRITYIACYWKCSVLHCIEVPCQSRLWKADHVYLILCYNGNLVTWTVVSLTAAKLYHETSCIPISELMH
jgi:hypothetical protein